MAAWADDISPAAGTAVISPNGALTSLRHGDYAATVTQLGGALHSLTHRGRDLVLSWDLGQVRPFFRGSVLLPWPNRLGDGLYEFGGVMHQVALTEPERHNALHGLSSWIPFEAQDAARDRVRLSARIWPQPGYPFALDVGARYRLDDDGLHWDVLATNAGPGPAPYGATVHPYLVAGPGRADDWTLAVPATHHLRADPERLLPVAVEALPAELDFSTPRRIAGTRLDHAFTGLTDHRVELTAPGGTGVAMTFGDGLGWLQLHTADRPEPELDRIGLAVEPMTCPPDAFRTGTDLVVLAPGESHTMSLTISALG